jgi:very-short-patch-repair endonuclease
MLKYDPRLKGVARTLRANLTDSEQRLWSRLRRKQILGVQFYRQKPIGQYVVDFYAPAVRLVVEVDGGQHLEPEHAKRDRQRTGRLQSQGLKILRFTDHEVLLELDAVVEAIFTAVGAKRNPPQSPFFKGGGLRGRSQRFGFRQPHPGEEVTGCRTVGLRAPARDKTTKSDIAGPHRA